MAIEENFPLEQVAPLATAESKSKHNYRPIYSLHKWWARRLGSIFRTIGISTFAEANDPADVWLLRSGFMKMITYAEIDALSDEGVKPMAEVAKHIPQGVIKRISFKNENELVFGAKKVYMEHIHNNMRGGKKFIEYLEQIYEIEPSENSIEELCEKMKLAEVYYYFTYLHTATRSTLIFKFKEPYLFFSWGDVPGNDDEQFIEFLTEEFGLGWAENAKILKSDDDKIISAYVDGDSAEMTIDEKEGKTTLELSDDRTYNLTVRKEDGKLNIYKNSDDSELFGDFGQPIWSQELEDKPKLWLCHKEDTDHVFLTFIFIAKEKLDFDPIYQDFSRRTETGIINCRIHFDDRMIEVTPKNAGDDFVEEVIEYIKEEFDISQITPISIDDQDIREFDQNVLQVTHEKREGEDATTALTRANKDGDTRNDVFHINIEDRDFKKEHGVLEINSTNRAIIGLTRDEKGKIQFKSNLVPADRMVLFHKLKNILRW